MTTELVLGGLFGTSAYSPDGASWTQTTPGLSTIVRVAHSSDLDQWLVTAGSGGFATSSDGITWTAGSISGMTTLRAAAWSSTLGLWVIGGDSGRIFTSSDGATWTEETSPVSSVQIDDMVWADGLGLFVGVARSTTGSFDTSVITSPDGKTWSVPASSTAFYWMVALAWSPTLGVLVAAAQSPGGTNRGYLFTSTDGTLWVGSVTGYDDTTGRYPYAVTWSETLGLFIAAGTAGYLETSPDGTNWTSRTTGLSASRILGAAWSETLGLFAITTNKGEVSTSPDGTTWTPQTSTYSSIYELYDIAAREPSVVPPGPVLGPTTGYIGPGAYFG